MWVFTETGFVSAVRKVDSPSKITVRSRDKQSLEVLAELSETEILETPYADYGYRVLVSDDIYKVWLSTTVDMLDYDNFKNRIVETRGHVFHDALSNVWTEMLAVSDNHSFERENYMTSSNSPTPAPRIGDLWVNPNTNAILSDPTETSNPSLRHYFGSDVEAALSAWGVLLDEVAAVTDVRRIISDVLSEKKTKIHEVYFPDSKSYVAIVLEEIFDRGSIFIASGYVDHYAQIHGSTLTKNQMIWRSLLPTSHQSSPSKVLPPIPHVLCPNCFLQIPITGQCGTCEWLPNPYDE